MTTNCITERSGFAHLHNLPCYELQCGDATAVISPYGAHLLSYQPKHGIEVIYLSPEAVWQNKSPIRGGVPVCWPWFGPATAEFNPTAAKLANHGLVRTEMWQLVRQNVTETEVSVEFRISPSDLQYSNAPSSISLFLKLTAADLTIELNSDQGVQQAALHSYFNVSSVHQAEVSDLTGPYLDKVDAGALQRQTTAKLRFCNEVDRVYQGTTNELSLSDGFSTVQIRQQGHDASVLWNPWAEKAAALKDLPNLGYQDFVCIETARLDRENTTGLHLVQQIRYLGQLE